MHAFVFWCNNRPVLWVEIKTTLGDWAALDRDALHVYFGLLAQIAAAAVLRKSLGSLWPWLVVLILEAANEALDIAVADGGWIYAHSLHDLWNTMLAPTILLLLVRHAPGLFAARGAGEG